MKRKFFLAILLVVTTAIAAYAQQPDWSLVPYRSGDKWGYATADKQIVIQPQYDEAAWFSGGYAAVKKGGKYGYINRAGKVVIPFKYYVAKPFRYGYVENKARGKSDTVLFAGAAPKADGYEVCINTKGVQLKVCPAMNEMADPVNRVPMQTTQKVYTLTNAPAGLFDKITDDYTLPSTSDNYYIAQRGGMYGVFNNKFETVIPFEYSSLTKFNIGTDIYLQGKKNNGMNGIFKGDGMVVMTPEYTGLTRVTERDGKDYFIVTKDGRAYVRSVDNKDIFPSEYNQIDYDNNGGFVLTDGNNNKGFYFMNNTSISPKYSDVKLVNRNGNFVWVKTKDGKGGYVSNTGTEYWQ
jgi:hypothetical protein